MSETGFLIGFGALVLIVIIAVVVTVAATVAGTAAAIADGDKED